MTPKSSSPIIFTGGHHNSALIIAKALKQKGYPIVWIGHTRTMIGDNHPSLEFQEVTAAEFKFFNLTAGKFHPKAHFIHLLRIPVGLLQALIILIRTRPRLIFSSGGYLAVPVVIAGKILSIPSITLEQTTSVGRANQLIGKFTQKNLLVWPSSAKYFPSGTTKVVGLPLPENIFKPITKKWFKEKRRTLLITGGKQGSHPVNTAALAIMDQLVKTYNVIHLTGASRKTQDHHRAISFKNQLKPKLKARYHPAKHLNADQMVKALKSSDLVVSRSGAHIIYELLALSKPAILIPLPFSYKNEQYKNALMLQQAGIASILPQSQLTPNNLHKKITTLKTDSLKTPSRAAISAKNLITKNATKTIVDYIDSNFPL